MDESDQMPDFTTFGDYLDFYASLNLGHQVWPFIELSARKGVFYSDPRLTFLAIPVNEAEIRGSKPDLTEPPDAWHILFASGEIHRMFDIAPYELPKVIWGRNGESKYRTYAFNKLKKRVNGKSKSTTTRTTKTRSSHG